MEKPHHPLDLWRPRTEADQLAARRATRRGELQKILPCVYGPPGSLDSLEHRAAALQLHDPNAIIVGAAAARLSWWSTLAAPFLTAARGWVPPPAPGFRWQYRDIPPDLVTQHDGLLLTSPALTVLDLIPTLGGNAVDEALRRGAATLAEMWAALALTPGRRGNTERRWLLEDSRDEPWSEAERDLHRHYRDTGLPWNYTTNHWMSLSDGRRTALDFALPELRLYFEADGFAFHGTRAAFDYDRDRDSDLEAQGWHGVRWGATFLADEPEQTRFRIGRIVEQRALDLGVDPPTPRAGGR